MSGIYDFMAKDGRPPVANPVGALGDISAALFATIGILAALRHRDATGRGQYVDVAMLDALVAMTDIVTNFWSMGLRGGDVGPLILTTFRASDGWFVLQVVREPQFAALARVIGHPEWLDDDRLATRQGWVDHLDDVIRPAIEAWATDRTKTDACDRALRRGPGRGSVPQRRGGGRTIPTWRPATCWSRCPAPTASTSRSSRRATR